MTFLAFLAEHWIRLVGAVLCVVAVVSVCWLSWKAGSFAKQDAAGDAAAKANDVELRRRINQREIAGQYGVQGRRVNTNGESL